MRTEPEKESLAAEKLTGIQMGLDEEFYHSQTWAVSNSDLKVFGGDSPAHYLARLKGAPEDDSALTEDERKTQVMGRLVHLAILEPKRFARESSHYVKPLTYTDEKKVEKAWNGNANVCKAWIEEHADKPVINEKEERRIIGARDAVLAHPVAGALLSGLGSNEVSVFAKHPATGLRLRMRADRLTEDAEGRPWCVDLKSCPNVDFFVKSARDFSYDKQAYFYRMVLDLSGVDDAAFCFVAFELAPRFGIHAVRLVMMSNETLTIAGDKVERELKQFTECRKTDIWPLGNEEIEMVEVKRWTP